MQGISANQILLNTGVISLSGNNFYVNSTPAALFSGWSNLNWGTNTIWNVTPNIYEDRKILTLTGNTNLQISGLYNGWGGVLKIVQSGTYTLNLPSGAKVINSGVGVISLTSGQGAIDIFGLEYDGTHLLVGIGNTFN